MSTRYYKNTVSITDTENTISLPLLMKFSIKNTGNNDCQFEIDGDIETSSQTLEQGIPLSFSGGYGSINFQAGAGLTTTVIIIGEKQFI